MKKVTIQTKEKVAELMDMWTIKFGMPAVDEAVRNGVLCLSVCLLVCSCAYYVEYLGDKLLIANVENSFHFQDVTFGANIFIKMTETERFPKKFSRIDNISQ